MAIHKSFFARVFGYQCPWRGSYTRNHGVRLATEKCPAFPNRRETRLMWIPPAMKKLKLQYCSGCHRVIQASTVCKPGNVIHSAGFFSSLRQSLLHFFFSVIHLCINFYSPPPPTTLLMVPPLRRIIMKDY